MEHFFFILKGRWRGERERERERERAREREREKVANRENEGNIPTDYLYGSFFRSPMWSRL